MEKRKRQESPLLESEYFRSPLKDTFQLNRKSQISTPKSKQSSDHKFVRFQIKSLPHHDQSSLEEKRDFIVVFQSIQIQRLSDQVQTQRKKIRDYERKLTNAENYQIQIRQLTDQCNALQGQISQYREQLQKMNKICEKIYHENDNLKQRLKQSDKKRKSEPNLIQITIQNKNLLRQIEQLTKQNKQLQLSVKAKQKQKQNSLFTNSNRRLTANSNTNYNGATFLSGVQNQAKLEKLSEEIYRLTQVICNKNSQIDNLQEYLQQIKRKCKQYFLKNYKQQSNSQLNLLQQQLSYIREEYKKCKNDLKNKQNKCNELQLKQKALENDLKQIEQIRKVCQQQQQIINSKMKQLQQLKQQQVQHAHMEQLMAQKQITKQLSHKIHQYQSQLQMMAQKNQQNSSIHSRIGLLELTIQSLKADYGKLLQQLSNVPQNDTHCNWQEKSQVSGKKLGELRNFYGGFGYNSMLVDGLGSQGLPIRNGDSRYSKF